MSLCSIAVSHSSTPCDILHGMFRNKTKYHHAHAVALPATCKHAFLLPGAVCGLPSVFAVESGVPSFVVRLPSLAGGGG